MVTAVCWGAGWDSSAALIEMKRRGERPDLITMADVGAEKNVPDPTRGEQVGTYDFIPLFSQWRRDADFPEPVICSHRPAKPETVAKYRAAAERVIDVLRDSRLPTNRGPR